MTGATGGGGRPEVSWVGAFGYLAICLTLLAFNLLLAIDPEGYSDQMHEDGWVENLTLAAYLLAAALLFAAAWAEERRLPRFILAAGGIAMAFIAGEELSWGQRILGFATPDYLFLSRDMPASIHSHLPWFTYWTLFLQFMVLPCVVTAAALFSRKTALFGVPLPSLPLMLALLAILLYEKLPFGAYLAEAHSKFWFSIFRGREEYAVLMILAAYALFSKRAALALAAGATLTLHLACAYVHQHNFASNKHELSEMLLGLFFLGYAGQLLLSARRERLAPPGGVPASASVSGRRGMPLPLWPTVSWLVLAASAALLIFEHFKYRAERAEIEQALQVARSAPPAARAEFDIHLIGRKLAYFKEPCSRGDRNDATRFFLHIFPENEADLPEHRKQYWFDNLDFPFFRAHGAHIQGSCMALMPLPDYPIARIRTGQHDGKKWHWVADFTLAE